MNNSPKHDSKFTNNNDSDNDSHNCSDCENIECKCNIIMQKFDEIRDLSAQIEHFELNEIVITIMACLIHLKNDENCMNHIRDAARKTQSELFPKGSKNKLN